MCGIIGIVGDDAGKHSVNALSELEIRGYDSAGLAVSDNGEIKVKKDVGYVAEVFKDGFPNGNVGIGHVRWATHGQVNRENAHPHLDCSGGIAVVHNGVIENFEELKKGLMAMASGWKIGESHRFVSETDTEVIAHLMEGKDLVEGVKEVSQLLKGENTFAVLSQGRVIASCGGPPLLVAPGEIASDALALKSKKFVRVNSGDVVEITANGYIFHRGEPGEEWSFYWKRDELRKNHFTTMFEKEIWDQPKAMRDAVNYTEDDLHKVVSYPLENIVLSGAGSSYCAAMYAKNSFELVDVVKNVEVVASGEWESFACPPQPLLFAVTQSGETATVLDIVRSVRKKHGNVIAVVNVPWSSLAAMSDFYLTLNCGAEVSVIASKSFIAECVVLRLVAAYMNAREKEFVQEVRQAADALEKWLPDIDVIMKGIDVKRGRCFVCGEGLYYPIAVEGAMKLKEGALIFAEPMIGSEFKHEALPLMSDGEVIFWIGDKTSGGIAQVSEIRSRGAKVIGISVDDFGFDTHIKLPEEAALFPPLAVVPFQLLTHYIAMKKGINEDRPRHLAKAITVR